MQPITCIRCKKPTHNAGGVCIKCMPPSMESLSTTPTDALPGTPDKIRVMTARAARREHLFHRQDAEYGDRLAFLRLLEGRLDLFVGVVAETSNGPVKVRSGPKA